MNHTLLISVLTLLSATAIATTTSAQKLEYLISNTETIARIQVVEAKAYSFEYQNILDTCGVIYQANVLETVRGKLDQQAVRFIYSIPLAVGAEYLVFLNSSQESEPNDVELISRWEYVESESYQQCKQQLPEAHLEGAFSFRFYEILRDENGQKAWLLKENFSLSLPDNIETMKVQCESEIPSGCEKISQPVLIHWPSLKGYIQISQED